MACDKIVNDFIQGDTPTWTITVYTDTTLTTTDDTTDWKAWCTFKSDKDLTDANAELQVSGVMTSANGALGLVSLSPTISESNSLAAGVYYYDFQVLHDTTKISTVEEGKVKVKQAVTIASS